MNYSFGVEHKIKLQLGMKKEGMKTVVFIVLSVKNENEPK